MKNTKNTNNKEKEIILKRAQRNAQALARPAEEDIKATNAEPLPEETTELDFFARKPAPIMEYGVPLLIFINRAIEHRRPRVIKNGEQQADTADELVFYEIKYKILDTEYGTKSAERTVYIWDGLLNAINRFVLNTGSKALTAVFSCEPCEYAERDKSTGELTGRTIQGMRDKLLSVAPLTPAELVEFRAVFVK